MSEADVYWWGFWAFCLALGVWSVARLWPGRRK